MEGVFIVAIVFSAIFGGGIIKLVLNHRKELKALEFAERQQMSQQQQDTLQQQVAELKQRVEVLERLVTDNKYQLHKEIASL